MLIVCSAIIIVQCFNERRFNWMFQWKKIQNSNAESKEEGDEDIKKYT